MTLTTRQKMAADYISDKLLAHNENCILSGPAGTGKTYTVSKLLDGLQDEGIKVQLLAPTHKACEVLLGMSPNSKPLTVHSALGLKPKILKNGQETLVSKGQTKIDQDTVALFIDECSMINPDLLEHIERFSKDHSIPVLYIGDQYQLPPVKETVSPVYTLDWDDVELHEVHRQAEGSGIIQLATSIRKSLESGAPITDPNGLPNVTVYDDYFEWFGGAVTAILKHDDGARIIGHTNAETSKLGYALRDAVDDYNTAQPQRGETLVSNNALVEPGSEQITVPNNAECLIMGSEETEFMGLPVYSTTFQVLGVGVVRAYTPKSLAVFERKLNGLKRKAITQSKRGDNKGWREFYKLKGAVADLRPRYALTAYKSQGSTFREVFLQASDLAIIKNFENTSYLRCLYTAVTRPSHHLHIYGGL